MATITAVKLSPQQSLLRRADFLPGLFSGGSAASYSSVRENVTLAGLRCFTLHNLGQALSPYRIYSRRALVRSLEAIGYRLVDSWRNADLGCYIPFHPEKTVREYVGLYCEREQAETNEASWNRQVA
jgi:hypothetical protein